MSLKRITHLTIITLLFLVSCKETPSQKEPVSSPSAELKDSITSEIVQTKPEQIEEEFKLTEENAIQFSLTIKKTLKQIK